MKRITCIMCCLALLMLFSIGLCAKDLDDSISGDLDANKQKICEIHKRRIYNIIMNDQSLYYNKDNPYFLSELYVYLLDIQKIDCEESKSESLSILHSTGFKSIYQIKNRLLEMKTKLFIDKYLSHLILPEQSQIKKLLFIIYAKVELNSILESNITLIKSTPIDFANVIEPFSPKEKSPGHKHYLTLFFKSINAANVCPKESREIYDIINNPLNSIDTKYNNFSVDYSNPFLFNGFNEASEECSN